MKSELIVDIQPDEASIALLEDSRLVSLQKEARNIAYSVGDIYIAKVKKLMPGLNAAFVNVGYEKDAFLHYLDLGPRFATYKEFMSKLMSDKRQVPDISKMQMDSDIDKHGSIADQIQPGQELMVQIVKEPISSKGPRLTTEITFTGRYMVLIPFGEKISVSQKIKTAEEKSRLRQLIASIKPPNFGVIIRTSAEGKRVAELINEMKTLLNYWNETCARCQKLSVPSLVFEEESRIVGMLRDVFTPEFEAIHVNDEEVRRQIANYVSLIAPDCKDIIHLYDKPEPIFDTFGVTRQIKSSFGKTVSFKSGAYIIIEHTEALHVIDVNSGNRTKAGNDQETNALDVNLRAADEIARQLRLRDMGGIIVIDFIDMTKNEHRQQLYDHMKEIMAKDRARHNILPLSKFGLMQITRQRVRPALDIVTDESCPSCHGQGRVQPSLLFTDTLFEKLEYVCKSLNIADFILYVHPYVDAYIKKGWIWSLASKWKRALGHNFRVVPDQSLAYLEYKVVDKDGNVLDLKEEKDTEKASRTKHNERNSLRGLLSIDEEASEVQEKTSSKTKKQQTEVANNAKNNADSSNAKSIVEPINAKKKAESLEKNDNENENKMSVAVEPALKNPRKKESKNKNTSVDETNLTQSPVIGEIAENQLTNSDAVKSVTNRGDSGERTRQKSARKQPRSTEKKTDKNSDKRSENASALSNHGDSDVLSVPNEVSGNNSSSAPITSTPDVDTSTKSNDTSAQKVESADSVKSKRPSPKKRGRQKANNSQNPS
ncbi:MAG: Rne/Rng family ribonuclease [Muribaculaceae bacterium]|nr:Rne/Rng family ribonuclease [Muribaculaceae bacterium]